MPTLAQKLRGDPTDPERRMWNLLRQLRTTGYHFRKQVALGPYIADFVCFHAHGTYTVIANYLAGHAPRLRALVPPPIEKSE